MSTNGRDTSGRFAPGNPGGPGRRRLTVEREYLAALGQAVSLDDWRQVVARALADAKNGDSKAREWLAKYVLGDQSPSLLQLAADEQVGLTAEGAVASLAVQRKVLAGHQQFKLALADMLSQHGVPVPQPQ